VVRLFSRQDADRSSDIKEKTVENRYYRFEVGEFECVAINDGDILAPLHFPDHLADKISRYTPKIGQMMYLNVLAVRTGKNNILIDTGIGAGNEATAGKTIENLKAAGISPGEIDTVILTHVHLDHIGGTADSQGRPYFPNARYIIHKKEWDYWREMLDWPDEKIPEFKLVHIKFARKFMPPILGQLDIIDDQVEIRPGIRYELAAGHSPAGMMINIASGKNQVLYTGDIVHDTVEAEAPEAYFMLDVDTAEAKRARDRIILEAIAKHTLVFASHLAFPGLGHFVQEGKTWRWKPV